MKLWLTLLPLIAPNVVGKNCLNAEAFITETVNEADNSRRLFRFEEIFIFKSKGLMGFILFDFVCK